MAPFSIEDLRSATDPAWFERGRRYHSQGRARSLRLSPGRVTALVEGTRPYRVELVWGRGLPATVCSCPLGQDGADWCKHAVAVALAWLAAGAEEPGPPDSPPDLRGFLSEQEPEWLVEQLLELTEEDPAVRARLEGAAGADAAVDTARADLEQAIADYTPDPDGWGPEGATGERRLDRAIDTLDVLAGYGYGAEVVGLAREAAALFDDVHGGHEDGFSDRLHELAEG
ncbi:SWIM zinc finger family protein [Nocardiopsis sp. CNT-189]|uniref:SWIM zinc finger family protein n=1 Tax=Nocardiopsis oceanisediminis TaxID=2816862 RepID=UPI003B396830